MSIPALPSDPTNTGRRFTPARIALLVVLVAAGAFLVARQDGVSPGLSFTDGVRGSGVPATQARTVPSFGAIDLTGSSSITVHVGTRQTVVVHADDNLINRVTTDVRDGVLVVSERGSFSTNLPLNVEVTVPTLAAARLMGSGTITAEGVTAERSPPKLPGSGLLTVSGTVARLDATLAGSGNMQLGEPHRPLRHSHRARLRTHRRPRHSHAQCINPRQRPNRLQRPPENRQPDSSTAQAQSSAAKNPGHSLPQWAPAPITTSRGVSRGRWSARRGRAQPAAVTASRLRAAIPLAESGSEAGSSTCARDQAHRDHRGEAEGPPNSTPSRACACA